MQNLQRVRRYQRELEDAEGRADQAESSLHLIRAKHRSSVVTGKGEHDRMNSSNNMTRQKIFTISKDLAWTLDV